MKTEFKDLLALGLTVFLLLSGVSMAGDNGSATLADKSPDSQSIENALRTLGHVRVLIQVAAPKTMLSPSSIARIRHSNALRSVQNQLLTRHFGSPEQARLDREFKRDLTLFDISPLIAVTVNEQELKSLLSDPATIAISLDAWDKPHLMDSVPLIGMTGSGGGAYAMGATGEGQAVAVLDTGVQADHPFLQGKVIAEACFSNAVGNTGETTLCPNGKNRQYGAGAADPTIPNCYLGFENICDHGTHVAGIAAGEKPTIGDPPNGVAMKSKLIALQVFTRIGNGVGAYVSDQILALEWIYANLDTLPGGNKLAAVNMSLGGGEYTDFCDQDPRLPIIYQLKLAGVATVISSGNDSFDFAVSAPACISSAVAVGATTKGDVITGYSNQSESLVDLLAPGGEGASPSGIASSIPVGTYTFMSGTSMAAPHVAGAFAAIRTARPEASVDEIELALQKTGKSILSRGGLFYSSRIQVNAALSELTRTGLPQTITFAAAPKLSYGGTGIVTATASSGLPVAFATKTPATCSVSVDVVMGTGAGNCTIIASQDGNVTYLPAPRVTQSFEVAKAKQTIVFNPPADLVYRETRALNATATSGLTVAYQSNTPLVCTIDGVNVTAVGVGSCRITASQAGNANYLAAPDVTKAFAVGRAPQTIAFTPPDGMVYGETAVLTATASSGLPVNFKTLSPAVCKVEGSTLIAIGVGACSVTALQKGNEYYLPAPGVDQSITIGKAPQTITFNPPGSLVYGESTTLSANATSGLPVTFASNSPANCNVVASTVTAVGAGACSITATQTGDELHLAASPVTQIINVIQAPQTITFINSPAKLTYGTTAPISATASSGLPVSLTTNTPEVCSVDSSIVTAVGVGTCLVTASQSGNVNYQSAQSVSQSISVVRAAQVISFQPVSNLFYGETAVLTASASSGLTVGFKSATGSVCRVDAGIVTGVGYGVCTITATQDGSENYLPALEVSQSFSVEKLSQVVVFSLSSKISLGGTVTLNGTASSGLPVNFRTNSPEVCRVDGVVLTAIGFGVCSITANQVGDSRYASATAITQTLLVEQPPYPAPDISLDIILTGTAQGTVTSDPVGILCGNWCNWSFTKGTRVRLTAIPKDGTRFAGWSGACTGKKTSCTVKLGKARTVKARFK
ncbi:MAG: S8 family serine peptidase [Methylococcus sp.]